jgi:hypothetical protein
MTLSPSAVLICALVSLSVGCQPPGSASEPVGPLAVHEQSVEGEIGSWARTAPLTYGQPLDNAVLLGNGEVLAQEGILAERYNPYTHTWRPAQPACTPSTCLTVPGGIDMLRLPSDKVLARVLLGFGRRAFFSFRTYDPETDTWTVVPGGYNTNRFNASMTLLDSGQVLFAGGFTYVGERFVALASAELYDPATGTWTLLPGTLNTPRGGHTATVLYSGQVLVTGGTSDNGPLASAELYNPTTRTWSPAGTMSRPRSGHLALRLYSGNVMVLGDAAGSSTAVDMYDPYNARWFQGPALPFAQPTTATLLYSGEVLVTSGSGQAAVYSPARNAWLPTASPSVASSSRSAAVLLHTGQVLLMSGSEPVADRFTR